MTAPKGSPWTEERVATLERLWVKEGYSASMIALHFDCGMTRNAVIGKVHRLGMLGRSPRVWKGPSFVPIAKKVRVNSGERGRKKAAAPKAGRKVAKRQVPILTQERRVEILSITPVSQVSFFNVKPGQCRYPVGDWEVPVERKMYCGSPVQEQSSFCANHHLICWVPHSRQVRKAA